MIPINYVPRPHLVLVVERIPTEPRSLPDRSEDIIKPPSGGAFERVQQHAGSDSAVMF